jgi:hypothetical protein
MQMSNPTFFQFGYTALTSQCTSFHGLNFTLIFNGTPFRVKSLLASSFSRRIARLLQSDPLLSQLRVSDGEGPFHLVTSILLGREITIVPSDSLFLLRYARELHIDLLIDAVFSSRVVLDSATYLASSCLPGRPASISLISFCHFSTTFWQQRTLSELFQFP